MQVGAAQATAPGALPHACGPPSHPPSPPSLPPSSFTPPAGWGRSWEAVRAACATRASRASPWVRRGRARAQGAVRARGGSRGAPCRLPSAHLVAAHPHPHPTLPHPTVLHLAPPQTPCRDPGVPQLHQRARLPLRRAAAGGGLPPRGAPPGQRGAWWGGVWRGRLGPEGRRDRRQRGPAPRGRPAVAHPGRPQLTPCLLSWRPPDVLPFRARGQRCGRRERRRGRGGGGRRGSEIGGCGQGGQGGAARLASGVTSVSAAPRVGAPRSTGRRAAARAARANGGKPQPRGGGGGGPHGQNTAPPRARGAAPPPPRGSTQAPRAGRGEAGSSHVAPLTGIGGLGARMAAVPMTAPPRTMLPAPGGGRAHPPRGRGSARRAAVDRAPSCRTQPARGFGRAGVRRRWWPRKISGDLPSRRRPRPAVESPCSPVNHNHCG
jgi:hypothetical protein